MSGYLPDGVTDDMFGSPNAQCEMEARIEELELAVARLQARHDTRIHEMRQHILKAAAVIKDGTSELRCVRCGSRDIDQAGAPESVLDDLVSATCGNASYDAINERVQKEVA